MPPSLDEMLPADHPARVVAAFVDSLGEEDWRQLGVNLEGEALGASSYSPRALLSLWLMGFMSRVRSARKLEAAVRNEFAYLWLSGLEMPDHNTLWRFYRKHRDGMRVLIKRTVEVAAMAGLVEFAIQAVDGTKVVADANRFNTRKGVVLEKLLSLVDDEIGELERQNKEDNGPTAYKLPSEYQNSERLRNKIGEALNQIKAAEGRNTANLTDPDARTMRARSGFVTGYNAQVVVSPMREKDGDAGSLLITAADVCTDNVDYEQLLPMMEQAQENTGVKDSTTLADSGYWSGKNLEQARVRGQKVIIPDQTTTAQSPYHRSRFVYYPDTDCYECPEGQVLTFRGMTTNRGVKARRYLGSFEKCRGCHAFGTCTKDIRHGRALDVGPNAEALKEQRQTMQTPEAKALYSRRQGIVEPVFGIMKEIMGARRFLLRGLPNVTAEWTLLATAFNLLSIWRMLSRMTHERRARFRWVQT